MFKGGTEVPPLRIALTLQPRVDLEEDACPFAAAEAEVEASHLLLLRAEADTEAVAGLHPGEVEVLPVAIDFAGVDEGGDADVLDRAKQIFAADPDGVLFLEAE